MRVTDFVKDISKTAELGGLIDQSALRQAVWSRDASHFQITPKLTARARDTNDVSGLLATANRWAIPVTFRSGGSSLSGQALGDGLVIDVRSQFQEIINIEPSYVRAQPGVNVSRVNGHLLRHGRKIGPDPASMVVSTLGGVVANNSSGMSCGVANNSYATILGATIVFADGFMFDTTTSDSEKVLERHKPELVKGLLEIRESLRSHTDTVDDIRRLFRLKNTMGYSLQAFLDYDSPVEILLHLMVGSQGTLGFVADVTLATIACHMKTASALLAFDSLTTASGALLDMAQFQPSAIELLDQNSLQALSREGLLPDELQTRVDGSSVAVLVDFEADEDDEVAHQAKMFSRHFSSSVVVDCAMKTRRDELWKARKNLYAVVAKNRPPGTTALLEDIVVPPEKLTQACQQLSDLCEAFHYDSPVFFGHVRDGNLHFMISDDFSQATNVTRLGEFTDSMVDIVLALGGNLKAEHGAGRAMAPFVERQFGPQLYQVMRKIKTLCDYQGILNPGIIFAADPEAHLRNVKQFPMAHPVVDSCVECGFCESNCPSTGLTLTPRERIVAMRGSAGKRQRSRLSFSQIEKYEIDQTCAVDGMCAVNFPVGINTGSMVKDLRRQQQSGLTTLGSVMIEKVWAGSMTLGGYFLKIAKRLPTAAEWSTKLLRSVAPRAAFPQYNRGIPSDGFRRSTLPSAKDGFVFLPSCMNSIFGDRALEHMMKLASKHGVDLTIPADIDTFCCGTPFSSKGFETATRRRTKKNTALLEKIGRRTLIIDGSSCHETLSSLSPNEPMEITQFLADYLLEVPVKNRHARLILHPTCSGEKTGSNRAMEKIARHISDQVHIPTDWKCCGFGGDRGLLVPEITTHSTRAEIAEMNQRQGLRVSNNQPCQVGMSRESGHPFVSILAAWVEAVK